MKLTIVGSIILGLVSVPIARIKKPRFFWGSAGLDPISFLWMISFFLFGPKGAFLSSIIGAIGIAKLSTEKTPRLGASLKFIGTMCVWGSMTIMLFGFSLPYTGKTLNNLNIFIPFAFLSAIVRCLVEIPLCVLAIPYFLTVSRGEKITTSQMIEEFGGLKGYLLKMVLLNFWLTFLDTAIPWVLTYPTGIYSYSATW